MNRLIITVVLSAAALAASAQDGTKLEDLERRILQLETGAANASPAKSGLSAFNPALGMAIDTVLRDSNDKANFQFRAAEVNIEAPIDPYLKGWAIITGSNGGVAVEEATIETTALPWNLKLRGGRLFAQFGRMGHFHDHELPVIERPPSLATYIGGETQADGVEASYLLPTGVFANLTFGAYNKMGADNDRQDNGGPRALDEFTYLGRVSAYQDVSDSQSLELGASSAWTPKRTVTEDAAVTGAPFATTTRKSTWRTLSGTDLTYRYQPTQGGLYSGLLWGTEVLQNNERRFNPSTRRPVDRVRSYAGYSFVQLKLGRHWRPGVMVDLTEDQDNAHLLTRTATGFLTYDVTEFQRLRLAFSQAVRNGSRLPREHTVAFQWSAVLGHHVHGFRDR